MGENARTPTDDFPDEIVDAPWVLQSYFSASLDLAPSADAFVRFDDNKPAYHAALQSLEAVSESLSKDNEIGARYPSERDQALQSINAIRLLLEAKEGWRSKLIHAAWITFCFILAKFADHPVAYLADTAWHALQSVVGIN